MRMASLPIKSKMLGFTYVGVMVAAVLIAVALVPAMQALQTGIMGTAIGQDITDQHYKRQQKLAELQAEPFASLLAAAKLAGNKTTATATPYYSDAGGTANRNLVYLALYDADADPFTITDPNTDGDSDLYTGSTANLLWLRVETEATGQGIETLVAN